MSVPGSSSTSSKPSASDEIVFPAVGTVVVDPDSPLHMLLVLFTWTILVQLTIWKFLNDNLFFIDHT